MPASMRSSAAMQFSRVDLPTPDSPTTATNSPRSTVEVDVAEDDGVAIALGQPAHREHARRGIGRHAHGSMPPANVRAARTTCAIASASSQAMTCRCGMLRSQVSWRFASCRVAAVPVSVSLVDAAVVERGPGLPVADRAHRRQVGMEVAARAQRPHLVDEAGLQHRREALRDARVQPAARRAARARSAAHARRRGRRVWRCEIGAPVTRCTSSARWIRCASRGAMRAAATGSTRRELGVQRRPAFVRRAPFQLGADRRIGGRHLVDAVEQRLEVQHRAADQQRRAAARRDVVDQALRIARRSARPNRRRPDRGCRSGGGRRACARPRSASRCRCPCRGRPAPNRR